VFFGLSGTGKTTLSADASRTLIGDDEHGWSDTAVFNFEGGCYAKMIRLGRSRTGNLCHDQAFRHRARKRRDRPATREIDAGDHSLAENSRGSYPIDFIPNASEDNLGPISQNCPFS
jgi:phosphoenolpyruvate carboxykinase (ATP)